MGQTPIRLFLMETFSLSDGPLLNDLAEHTVCETLEKGRLLMGPGEDPRTLFVLISGILRGYVTDEEGQEITDCFLFRPGQAALGSAAPHQPASVYGETLCVSTVAAIPVTELERMLQEHPALPGIYNRILAWEVERQRELRYILCRTEAMERYRWFLREYPGLIDRVNNRYVASFLNMSPVTLSRLRTRLRQSGEAEEDGWLPPDGEGVRLPGLPEALARKLSGK